MKAAVSWCFHLILIKLLVSWAYWQSSSSMSRHHKANRSGRPLGTRPTLPVCALFLRATPTNEPWKWRRTFYVHTCDLLLESGTVLHCKWHHMNIYDLCLQLPVEQKQLHQLMVVFLYFNRVLCLRVWMSVYVQINKFINWKCITWWFYNKYFYVNV